MRLARFTLLGPLALFLVACGEKATNSPGASTGGTGATATGGTSGASGTGGASGGTTTGGSGGTATGGGAGTGGSSTGGAGPTGGTGGSGVSCTISVTQSVSPDIGTVGIVEFTSDLAGITEAHIDFGIDTSYGMTAPVDMAAANYRTLLLGMKASSMYHFRVVATGPTGTCTGTDNTIATGSLPNGLPRITVTTNDAAALAGGFLVTGLYTQGGAANGAAYILDKDGDVVWWFLVDHDVPNARLTYDGKSMWISNANVPAGEEHVHKVSMDGMTDEDHSTEFAGMNHQFTVLPDETVIFYAYNDSVGCDDIKERSPSGTVRTIVNSRTAHGATTPMNCHVNMIEYSREDDTVVFSDLDHGNYTKIRRTGEVVWVLGGSTSDFTGAGSTWTGNRQHGVDVLGLDRLLIFSNGAMGGRGGGTASPSVAIEIALDLTGMAATQAWTYTAMPTLSNAIMGDVQRLDNGNTIVGYSTQGVLQEVSPAGQVLQELEWNLPGVFGYIQKRKTLYGPPPR